MISKETQHRILKEILEQPDIDEKGQTNMLFGVVIALGQANIPPYWIINLICGRIDRLFAEVKPLADHASL